MPTSVQKLRDHAFKVFEGGNMQVSAELEKAAAMIEAAALIAKAIESVADAIRYHGDMDI